MDSILQHSDFMRAYKNPRRDHLGVLPVVIAL